MIRKLTGLLIIYFFFYSQANASVKENIIENLKSINNLTFDFEQNINGKKEKGNCIIEYPKKIYCLYKNLKKKLLVSNGKNLVIKNQISNQYYIYPIEKTALNLILDKNYLVEKINLLQEELVDEKFYRFKFAEGDYEINIFFDKKNLNLIGWQNIDIYQNLVITYLYNIQKNTVIEKNQFKLPSQN